MSPTPRSCTEAVAASSRHSDSPNEGRRAAAATTPSTTAATDTTSTPSRPAGEGRTAAMARRR